MRLYRLARVKRVEAQARFEPELEAILKRRAQAGAKAEEAVIKGAETVAAQLAAKRALEEALLAETRRLWGDTRFASMFPVARGLDRRLRLFVGPTNSGKTYHALMELKGKASACYLAPLRLLALEGQARVEEMGLPCSLVTGEERDLRPGAQAVASTIEMMDERQIVDLAIIDEIQLLHDPDRGWAWVNALVGVPAREVIMTGSADVIPTVRALADYLGAPLEVVHFERHNPLVVDARPTDFNRLKPQTALIAFSRREVLELSARLRQQGRGVAVIYGALGPEVRREEARRFREGEAEILVASDAIGMGLNLPIRHIVFYTSSKWDGQRRGTLDVALTQQIAGRAGRFGFHDSGCVGALEEEDLWVIRGHMSAKVPSKPLPLSVLPSRAQVHMLAAILSTQSLISIFITFAQHMKLEAALFKPGRVDILIQILDEFLEKREELSLDDKYTLCLAPINLKSKTVLSHWQSYVDAICANEAISPPKINTALYKGTSTNTRDLQEAEDLVQSHHLYRWLAFRFESIFNQPDLAKKQIHIVNSFIKRSLNNPDMDKVCARCGVLLPKRSPHTQCDDCFFDHRGERPALRSPRPSRGGPRNRRITKKKR
ncbi:helicase [Myxococcota bacterium]|nr:helicase [Myxococcota bacterium]MBU1429228.1 helicase [Myxococcota bacterium]MBU1900216.1 helicase [Myxococcota bacterium]